MTTPRKHTTKSAQGRRRSHLKLKKVGFSKCKRCGSLKLSHKVCPNCGYYKGMQVVDVLKRELKKKEKQKGSR